MPITLIIIALLGLGNLVTYGAMAVRERIVVAGAVKAERVAQVAACNVRVEEVAARHNEAVSRAASEARKAGEAVGVTPVGAELVKLCNASASCRSRGKL